MKLASFLFPGSGGRAQADSDTALIDDVPPTHALDTFAPDTVADSTLMAGHGSFTPAYAVPPTAPRGEAAAPPRRRVRLPWISAMPFRKQVQVLLPTLALSLLMAFVVRVRSVTSICPRAPVSSSDSCIPEGQDSAGSGWIESRQRRPESHFLASCVPLTATVRPWTSTSPAPRWTSSRSGASKIV